MSEVISLHFLPTGIKSSRWELSVKAVHIHQREVVRLCEIFTLWFSLCDLPSSILLISQMLSYLKVTRSHEKFEWICAGCWGWTQLDFIQMRLWEKVRAQTTALVRTLTFIILHSQQIVWIVTKLWTWDHFAVHLQGRTSEKPTSPKAICSFEQNYHAFMIRVFG